MIFLSLTYLLLNFEFKPPLYSEFIIKDGKLNHHSEMERL